MAEDKTKVPNVMNCQTQHLVPSMLLTLRRQHTIYSALLTEVVLEIDHQTQVVT
jgi:hypothetical protein